jgi:hypothetical protein
VTGPAQHGEGPPITWQKLLGRDASQAALSESR